MKYLKYFLKKLKNFLLNLLLLFLFFSPFVVFFSFMLMAIVSEAIDNGDLNLNPNDYCNLTDVNYTAVLYDDPDGSASVEITEYLTFDVHADSPSNTYKELWRELPEDYVDGLRITYDVESVSQILDNGQEIPYTETDEMYWEDYDYTESSTMYWHHSDGSGTYPDNDESLLIYIPWTYRDKLTFKIVYSMNNAALRYKDCSELYLSMYSGNTITKLNSYKAQILIPNEIMPSTYYAYTFGTSNSRLPYSESDTINPGYHTFSIDLDKSDLKFDRYSEYLEFCLLAYGDDKRIFTQNAPTNMYSGQNVLDECIAENEYYETRNERYKTYKIVLLVISILGSGILVISGIRKYKKMKEKYTFYEPEIDFDYFREISSDLDPIFASELVFMKDPFDENKEKKEEYAAILLSLVRKNYIKLTKLDANKDWTNSNTVISLEPIRTESFIPTFNDSPDYSPEPIYTSINENTGEKVEALTTSERLYLELLERHSKTKNNSITISQLQECINSDYEYTNSFIKDIEKKPVLENGVIKGYFQTAEYDKPKKEIEKMAKSSLRLGLFLLVVVNCISYFTPLALCFGAYTILGVACLWKYFYLNIKSSNLLLLTQFGANEQAKWYGLYNFLKSDTLIKEREIHELPLWEKYLIYATAFGISEKVIKAIKINAVELNIDNSPILNHNFYIHSHNFHRTSRALGRSIHTFSRGGGFRGHGYGGGGRGGGGGGGGH